MTIAYNEIAAHLIDGSAPAGTEDRRNPDEAADAIIATLSLTVLREYVRLHLTIDAAQGWTMDSETLSTEDVCDIGAGLAARRASTWANGTRAVPTGPREAAP